MQKIRFLIPALALLASGSLASGAQASFSAANRYMVMDHVRPGYDRLAGQANGLKSAAAAYCGAPDRAGREALDRAYQQAMLAWQGIQHIRFGPVEQADRQFRLQFWPDKRNRTGKALSKLKADVAGGKDYNLVTFAQTSVAVQGFPALERLLVQEDLSAADCTIVQNIAVNIDLIAGRLVDEWQVDSEEGYGSQILQADIGTDLFKKPKDAAFEFFKSFQTGLQVIREAKLLRPMGENVEKAKPKRAEAWRTGRSASYLLENAMVMARFYGIQKPEEASQETMAEGFSGLLRGDEEGRAIDRRMRASFQELILLLEGLDAPLAEMVSDAEGRETLEKAVSLIGKLRRDVDGPMAEKLEFFLGFNNLDGD